MTVETATNISQLNASYPAASDPKSEGDDHIRLVKSTLQATFPGITGVETSSATSNVASCRPARARRMSSLLLESISGNTSTEKSGSRG